MPLIHGKSKKAFEHNIKAEMDAGKPMKQSLAIAYNMKRKPKKMADGGDVAKPASPYVDPKAAKDFVKGFNKPHTLSEGFANAKKELGFAEGGQIKDNYQSKMKPEVDGDLMPAAHYDAEMESGFVDHMGDVMHENESAIAEDDRDLNQHGEHEVGPMGAYADGGQIMDNKQDDSHMLDMVGRIIAQRAKCYSKGGRVANDTPIVAGFKPNQFDDLVLRDDLESTYGDDDNSGDALGNAQEDKDRKDIVSRVMASRRKKDRMPSPA